MALSTFRRLVDLTKVKPAIAPSVGVVYNRQPINVAPTVPKVPATNPVQVQTLRGAAATLAQVRANVAAGVSLLDRSTKPTPEQPTTAKPIHLAYQAIRNVGLTVRMPDRGAHIAKHGVALWLPDGSAGGSPVTPKPIQSTLGSQFREIVARGGTSQVRQTQITTLAREAYLERTRARAVFANVPAMRRRGIVQRPGSAFVLKPFPSSPGALHKAQMHRRKPGTPTGIQGDRAAMYASAHVGSLYSRTKAPLSANVIFVGSKMGGTGAARVPSQVIESRIEAPNLAVSESVRKAYAWAPPKGESALADTRSQAGTVSDTGSQSLERILLLLGVAGAAFLLLRR